MARYSVVNSRKVLVRSSTGATPPACSLAAIAFVVPLRHRLAAQRLLVPAAAVGVVQDHLVAIVRRVGQVGPNLQQRHVARILQVGRRTRVLRPPGSYPEWYLRGQGELVTAGQAVAPGWSPTTTRTGT